MSPPAEAPVLVVAGGSGTGKSTVCGWLESRGAFVIEADRVGHELLLRPDVIAAVAERFGADVVGDDGRIDRRVLAPRVFASQEATDDLNRLMHPRLVVEIEDRVGQLRRSRAATLIVVDAALFFQFRPRLRCDAVVVTDAPSVVQEGRIQARDGIDVAEVRGRLARQQDLRSFHGEADAVLDTDRPPAEVRAELLELVDRLLGTRWAASDPPRRPIS